MTVVLSGLHLASQLAERFGVRGGGSRIVHVLGVPVEHAKAQDQLVRAGRGSGGRGSGRFLGGKLRWRLGRQQTEAQGQGKQCSCCYGPHRVRAFQALRGRVSDCVVCRLCDLSKFCGLYKLAGCHFTHSQPVQRLQESNRKAVDRRVRSADHERLGPSLNAVAV